jgi:uncharacterized protein YjbI with pentapeptide repeats
LDLFVLILIVSGVASVALAVLGGSLWWPERHNSVARAALGDALMTGAVVAFAIFLFQVVMEDQFSDIEGRRANEQAVQDLKLQVAVQDRLEGFDFRGARSKDLNDLSRFYFRGKKLSGADFRGVTLNDADFRGTDLSRAQFDEAKLNGAELISANLEGAFLNGTELLNADLTTACLRGATLAGADLTEADITGADLSDAEYNAETIWADGQTRECARRRCSIPPRSPRASTTCPA